VSQRNIQELFHVDLTLDEARNMLRLLGRYDRCSREEVRGTIRLLESIVRECGSKMAPFYGRTLLRLVISATELPLPTRLKLFLRGIFLVASDEGGRRVYSILKEWILTRRLIAAVRSRLENVSSRRH